MIFDKNVMQFYSLCTFNSIVRDTCGSITPQDVEIYNKLLKNFAKKINIQDNFQDNSRKKAFLCPNQPSVKLVKFPTDARYVRTCR